MKRLLFFLLFVSTLISASLFAQQQIRYTYDDAGNRIERLQIGLRDFEPFSEESDEEEGSIAKTLSREDIRVYPNPVQTDLTVSLTKLPEPGTGLLQIFNIEGKLVLEETVRTTQTVVSMEDCSRGIYLMKLTFGEMQSTWKIVKE